MIYKLLRHVTLEAGSYSSQNPPIFHLIPRNALICKLKPITLYWFLRQYFIDKSLAIFYISLGSVFFSIPYGITSRQPNTQNSNERKWELIILFLEECRSILLLLLLFFPFRLAKKLRLVSSKPIYNIPRWSFKYLSCK